MRPDIGVHRARLRQASDRPAVLTWHAAWLIKVEAGYFVSRVSRAKTGASEAFDIPAKSQQLSRLLQCAVLRCFCCSQRQMPVFSQLQLCGVSARLRRVCEHRLSSVKPTAASRMHCEALKSGHAAVAHRAADKMGGLSARQPIQRMLKRVLRLERGC